MNQNDLNRAVARATGETVNYIRDMGFSLHVVPGRKHHGRPVAQARHAPRVLRWSQDKAARRAA